MQKISKGDLEMQAHLEKQYQLKKLINSKCEEQVKIDRARKHWAILRKKKKIILQLGNLGSDELNALIGRNRIQVFEK